MFCFSTQPPWWTTDKFWVYCTLSVVFSMIFIRQLSFDLHHFNSLLSSGFFCILWLLCLSDFTLFLLLFISITGTSVVSLYKSTQLFACIMYDSFVFIAALKHLWESNQTSYFTFVKMFKLLKNALSPFRNDHTPWPAPILSKIFFVFMYFSWL